MKKFSIYNHVSQQPSCNSFFTESYYTSLYAAQHEAREYEACLKNTGISASVYFYNTPLATINYAENQEIQSKARCLDTLCILDIDNMYIMVNDDTNVGE